MDTGNFAEAIAAFAEALKRDPDDHLGALVRLKQLGAPVALDTLPPAFVTTLFDQYAPSFDHALLENLAYRVPTRLSEAVIARKPEKGWSRIVDLGCGTGLAAEKFIGHAHWMAGIDLSAGMLAAAAEKQIYDELLEKDVLAALMGMSPSHADLVLAADVFVYIGALDDIIMETARILTAGGLFAFTLQQKDPAVCEASPYILGYDSRYHHDDDYIIACINNAGMNVLQKTELVLRLDRGQDVNGLMVIAEKPGESDNAALPPLRKGITAPSRM